MLTLKIAWRNVFRQKRRTVLTTLTMLGGFTLSAVSIAWTDGTYNNIIHMFTRNQLGHIQVHGRGYLDKPSLYNQIDNYREVGDTIAAVEGVTFWAPRLYAAGLASVSEKSAGVKIIGIDPERESKATRFEKKLVSGRAFATEASHEVILGSGIAKTLKAEVGQDAVIVSQAADGSIANDLYRIVGIAESGDLATDKMAFYLHLEDAQELLCIQDGVHEIVVIAEELGQVRELAIEIGERLNSDKLEVQPWQEFAKSFYIAMKADKQGGYVGLFVMILIVAIGVLNTVLMTVLERTREYGVLRAVGTQPLQVFRLVIYEVTFMALISIIIGAGLSLLINYLLSIKGVTMPFSFTYGGVEFKRFYTEVNFHSVSWPAATVMLSALIVSIFPAARAARVAPARALRTH